MENSNTRPILVTGSHRSGSTWVGRMIAKSPEVGYIHEPFNVRYRPGICGARFDNWFTYVCDHNSSEYYDHLRKCLEFKYQFAKQLKSIRTPRNAVRLVEDYSRFSINRIFRVRPLMKDPIAVFSAEWLARTFAMDVIVLVRHPAAFAGSLKQANWPHPFQHFLNQPLLMKNHLSVYADEIEKLSREETDLVDQSILLWNLIHSTIIKYKKSYPTWHFVRHEDISANPVDEFRKIFLQINLNYSRSVQREILQYSSRDDTGYDKTHSIRRDSKASIWNWKKRLSNEEIERVRAGTIDVSSNFYGEEEW